jgi:hypothetical protein
MMRLIRMARRANLTAATSSSTRISIGPYFIRSHDRTPVASGIVRSGWNLELAGDAFATRLTVCQLQSAPETRPSLRDYLVLVNQIPFRVGYLPPDLWSRPGAQLMPLETVLTSLYREHEVSRSLESFLTELRQTLPCQELTTPRRRAGNNWVADKVAQAGFELIELRQFGTVLHARFAWVCPEDRDRPAEPFCYYAGAMEFRPTPARTLGKGKWILPMQTTFAHLLSRKLRSLLRGDLSRWLSPEGREAALGFFKWTKLSLLTRTELRQARVDFVRRHPQLHAQPRELARAMREAELYSPWTELYAIVKQLPRMLEQVHQ